jgi:hypothetical protein
MTLHPQHEFSIPEETARVARAAYPKGNLYMKMRDALGTMYQDQSFAHLFPQNGRPVEAPRRSPLVLPSGCVYRLSPILSAPACFQLISSRSESRRSVAPSRLVFSGWCRWA